MVTFRDTVITSPPYRGRFAPSPTGLLHEGSLLTAVASYLEARRRGGQWLLRMEDIDPPREMPGAADNIVRTLADFGFEWDGPILYQSTRLDVYKEVLNSLIARKIAYPCGCTRKEIADSSARGIDGPIYPGTCRNGLPPGRQTRAWRLRLEETALMDFNDAIQGAQQQSLIDQVGDFVLLRADGYFAYQLAVIVDDAEQGITDIVRGADLLDSTPRQLYLQRILGISRPNYAHLPILVNAAGEKLSKQTRAAALLVSRASSFLWQTLERLGQRPDPALKMASLEEIWAWSRSNWQLELVPQAKILHDCE
ncbi:tRNA glutamyl-Q(34) synthetase GluQRS [Chitinimonas sp. BJB300]|uniref:tRNA glutamyl-Q(34) synthetase GluQRS n=1 Tax=Chitinimonas sp. BJB300 TaxID=1559339 RepID=UPI000C10AE23|nr:tRNA glutamyl-Q(34) synthetase GluQRS [Chitinimonas sp. BJB300]PHV13313.1 tRNA glutamyl-Q(34) synthetase GluQRS [Chitinimonas sp. BJB300]TSJ85982.1 tRNA glutamyl-Q(34) synthetase GluQRS [Chitinimonas sp. BJB300]